MRRSQLPLPQVSTRRTRRAPMTRRALAAVLLAGLGVTSACGVLDQEAGAEAEAEADALVEDDVVHSAPLDAAHEEMLTAAAAVGLGEPAVVGKGAWTVLDVDLDARERVAELGGRPTGTAGQLVLVGVRMEAASDVPWSGDAHISFIGGDGREYFELCGLPWDLTVYSQTVVSGDAREAFLCYVVEPEAVDDARLVIAVPYEDDARPAVWSLD